MIAFLYKLMFCEAVYPEKYNGLYRCIGYSTSRQQYALYSQVIVEPIGETITRLYNAYCYLRVAVKHLCHGSTITKGQQWKVSESE